MSSGLLVYERDVIDQRLLVEALSSWLEQVYPLPHLCKGQQHALVLDDPMGGLIEAICRRLLRRLIPDAQFGSQWAARHPALDTSLVEQLVDERRLGPELFEARYGRSPQYWFGDGLWHALALRAERLCHLSDQAYVLLSARSQLDLLLTWTGFERPYAPQAVISCDEPDSMFSLAAWHARLGLTHPWSIASWSEEGYSPQRWDPSTWSPIERGHSAKLSKRV